METALLRKLELVPGEMLSGACISRLVAVDVISVVAVVAVVAVAVVAVIVIVVIVAVVLVVVVVDVDADVVVVIAETQPAVQRRCT